MMVRDNRFSDAISKYLSTTATVLFQTVSKSVEGTTSGFSATGRGAKIRVTWGACNPPPEKQPACPKPTAASPTQETTAAAIRVFRMVKGLVLLGPPPHRHGSQGRPSVVFQGEKSQPPPPSQDPS